jgi:NhaP-type Na+/H+ or K+/H+ antiporter
MWVIAGLIATAGISAAIEIPSLTGHKKDLWVFSLLLMLGTALGIAAALKVNIPNPLDWIAAVYQPFGNWMQSLFK